MLSFIFIMLTIVAFWKSLKKYNRGPDLLNRQQTEEWKGWMQVLLLFMMNVVSDCLCVWCGVDPLSNMGEEVYIERGDDVLHLGAIPALPLLQRSRDIQCHPRLYCRICVDDWLRQLHVLLPLQGLLPWQVRHMPPCIWVSMVATPFAWEVNCMHCMHADVAYMRGHHVPCTACMHLLLLQMGMHTTGVSA